MPIHLGHMHKAMLFLCGALLLASCRKDSDTPTSTPAAAAHCTALTGITPRDVMGALMAAPDTTDWRTREPWCPVVDGLFPTREGLHWSSEADSTELFAFPNPTEGSFRFDMLRMNGYADIRVVDTEGALLHTVDSTTAPAFIFDLDGHGLYDGELVRVYYRVVGPDSTMVRGQGDVRYTP